MEFGSEYVYHYSDVEYDYISDDEMEDGMSLSCSGGESDSDDEEPTKRKASRDRDSGGYKKKIHHWRTTSRSEEQDPSIDILPSSSHTDQTPSQRVRQGDTNLVSVKLDKLVAPSSMHAGDPTVCKGCTAILSSISKVTTQGDLKIWCCEFCEHRNVVDIQNEEVPTNQDVTFMLESALSRSARGPAAVDDVLVIFCVDTSGSMGVTTKVPGQVALRGAESARIARENERSRKSRHDSDDVSHISRLQSVQAAIDHQLQEMEREYPNRRVALVTFNCEVTVFGDGNSHPVSITRQDLEEKHSLKTIAAQQPIPAAIKMTRKTLGEKLFNLESDGLTALGPALLVSTEMAAKVRGSKVILCTDVMANVGLGPLGHRTGGRRDESTQFYENMAESASANGVSISVITMKGTDCRLVELGMVADVSGGQVNIVDPVKLTQEFGTILADKIIATNVVATFILHKHLFFFYEEDEESSKVVRKIGNVTADTEITFEFGVKTKADSEKNTDPVNEQNTLVEESMEVSQSAESSLAQADKNAETDIKQQKESVEPVAPQTAQSLSSPKADIIEVDSQHQQNTTEPVAGPSHHASEGQGQEYPSEASHDAPGGEGRGKPPSELPFQLQIVYTDTEGGRAMRLVTKTKPVTKDRTEAEKACNLKVLGAHTAQTTAKLALDGKYTISRQRALMNQRIASRHTKTDEGKRNRKGYKNMFGKIKSMENYLNKQQKVEKRRYGRTFSCSRSRSRSPSSSRGHRRSGSRSPCSSSSWSSSSSPINWSPSYSRSRSRSPRRSLRQSRSRSPRRSLRRSRSPRRSLSRSRSPRRCLRRSRSRSTRKSLRQSYSRSPRQSRTRSPRRSPRQSCSRGHRQSRSRSPRRSLRQRSSLSPRRSSRQSHSRSLRRSLRQSCSLSPRRSLRQHHSQSPRCSLTQSPRQRPRQNRSRSPRRSPRKSHSRSPRRSLRQSRSRSLRSGQGKLNNGTEKSKSGPANGSEQRGKIKALKTKQKRAALTSDTMADFMYKGKSSKKFFADSESD